MHDAPTIIRKIRNGKQHLCVLWWREADSVSSPLLTLHSSCETCSAEDRLDLLSASAISISIVCVWMGINSFTGLPSCRLAGHRYFSSKIFLVEKFFVENFFLSTIYFRRTLFQLKGFQTKNIGAVSSGPNRKMRNSTLKWPCHLLVISGYLKWVIRLFLHTRHRQNQLADSMKNKEKNEKHWFKCSRILFLYSRFLAIKELKLYK